MRRACSGADFRGLLQRMLNACEKFLMTERLLDEVRGAGPHGSDGH